MPNTTPRVLHLNTERTWRGGEQQMLYLLQGLKGRGLPARAVCQAGTPCARRCRQADIEVHEVRMRGEIDLGAARAIARIARATGSNLLHAHTSHAHSLAALASHLFLARCGVVVHRRIAFPVGRGMLGLGVLKYRLGVDAYVTVSSAVADTLLEVGVPGWKVFPVHSVTDPERFISAEPDPGLRQELGIPEDAFVLGNVAYLVGHKDHLNLLEAAARVRDELPDLWVVIVGKGPLRESIEQRARELGLRDRLVLTGFRTDVPQLIRTFDLFVLSSSEEGICSTLLDVMAAGCPIVGTRASGVDEAVLDGETGLLAPTRDPQSLAERILTMARDPETARRMARRGRERAVGHFTPGALTEKTLEAYRRVLERRVGPEHPLPEWARRRAPGTAE